RFFSRVKSKVVEKKLGTLTVEISSSDLIRHNLIDPKNISAFADSIVIMAYDYHFAGSEVTGPVAPMGGGGDEAEYDTILALEKAIEVIPSQKIILCIPLYGYQWETLDDIPRSAVIPGTGQTASNSRVENLLSDCATCSAQT